MKKTLALLLTVLLAAGIVFVVGCGGSKKDIVGTYESTAGMTMELKEDGTSVMSLGIPGQEAMTIEGTYKVEGDTLLVSSEELGGEIQFEIEGESLIDPSEEKWTKK